MSDSEIARIDKACEEIGLLEQRLKVDLEKHDPYAPEVLVILQTFDPISRLRN
jgi:hypothetical protein